MKSPTTTEPFTFTSGGESLVGNLFLPKGEATALVVTTGPFTSVKEQAAGVYAEAMAERGFAALAFDHRCFGKSGGEPRQFESPAWRVEDIRNAATELLDDARFAGLQVTVSASATARGRWRSRCTKPTVSRRSPASRAFTPTELRRRP